MANPIIMPRQGQSVESCILVEWLVELGTSVSEGEAVATIETDKATFDVEAPEDGEILAFFAEPGDDIPVLQTIAAIGSAGEDASGLAPDGASEAPTAAAESAEPTPEASPTPETPSTPAAAPVTGSDSAVGVSPRARGAAAKSGLDASALAGTGPGGRVIERDVVAAAAAGPHLSGAARDAVAAGAGQAPTQGSGPGGMVLSSDLQSGAAAPAAAAESAVPVEGQEVALSGIRKIIAQRMKDSLTNSAQLTMTGSFDATALLAFRKRVKAQGEALGLPSISINDLVLYAVARTLPKHPELNATFRDGKLIRYGGVNLGVAVDTPRGLMVPVVRGAHTKSLSAICSEVKALAASAQDGSVNPDLLSGGTFTVTTLGALGIENFTPVLNAPEVAILGVGGLFLKPVRVDGDVRHIDAMHLSLTIDHQVVDGAPGARFLKDLMAALENIDLTLAA